jgi:hypothetical protein
VFHWFTGLTGWGQYGPVKIPCKLGMLSVPWHGAALYVEETRHQT